MELNNLDVIKIGNDTSIDKNRLDLEHETQPQLVSEYTELQARADLAVNKIKDMLSYKSSELSLGYRKGELESGITGKLNNDMVKELVETNQDVVNLKLQYNEMNYTNNVLKGVVESLRNKRKSIDGLQYLMNNDYYSSSISTGTDVDMRAKRIARQQTRQNN